MIFKTTANALKGQNHQRRATPCDCRVGQFQALKGRQQTMCRLTPFQGLGSRMYPFHRALPDANAKRLSALTTITGFLFSIPKARKINNI
jgi:hypothetical protein